MHKTLKPNPVDAEDTSLIADKIVLPIALGMVVLGLLVLGVCVIIASKGIAIPVTFACWVVGRKVMQRAGM